MMNDFLPLLLATAIEAPEAKLDSVEIMDNAIEEIINQVSTLDDVLLIIGKVAITIGISFIIIQLYRYIWRRWWKKSIPKLQDRFTYNIILILLYISAIIAVIMQLPMGNSIVASLITSSGFVALGLGLAAQESLGNIINGMMLSISKPFQVGDRIHLINGNITGYVEDITLRHTVMRTFVNSRIIIPNSAINKDMIENSNYQQGRASSFLDVTITFDSDIDKAHKIMAEIVGSHKDFLDVRKDKNEPKVKVFIRDLSLNGICLRASMWTASIDTNFEACSDVRYAIQKRFKEEGILFAQMPSRPEAFARAGEPGAS